MAVFSTATGQLVIFVWLYQEDVQLLFILLHPFCYYYTVRQKKVIFCPHVLMVIFPFLGGKNDGK